MKNQKQDSKTIADTIKEFKQAAKTLDVDWEVIVVAKKLCGSNDRETIYKYIENHIGDTMGVAFVKLNKK